MNSLLVILVWGAVSCAAAPPLKCDQGDLRRCQALQPPEKNDVTFPSDPAELDAYCGRVQPSLDCHAELLEMCPRIAPKVSRHFFVSKKGLFDRLCDPKVPFRNAFLQFSKCLSGIFATQLAVCSKEAAPKEKFETCAYFRLVETCMQDKALQTCTRDSYYVFSEIYDVVKIGMENGVCDN